MANLVDARSYEAFGTRNAETGSDPLPYAFAGEAFDTTTNLAYHRARWMDSRVGRFTGMDRAEADDDDPRSVTRYVYGENEPTRLTDPTGFDVADIGSVPQIGNTPHILPSGSTTSAPGPVFADYNDAERQAEADVLQGSLSHRTSVLNIGDPPVNASVYPEYGTIIAFLPSGPWGTFHFCYLSPITSNAAFQIHGLVDLIGQFPAGSVPLDVIHSHANTRSFTYDTPGLVNTVTPHPNVFSKYDGAFLDARGAEWGEFRSIIITGSGRVLTWDYGWPPDPASAMPNGQDPSNSN